MEKAVAKPAFRQLIVGFGDLDLGPTVQAGGELGEPVDELRLRAEVTGPVSTSVPITSQELQLSGQPDPRADTSAVGQGLLPEA